MKNETGTDKTALTAAQLRWLRALADAGGEATKPAGNRAAARASAAWVRNAEACYKLNLVAASRSFDYVRILPAGRALTELDGPAPF